MNEFTEKLSKAKEAILGVAKIDKSFYIEADSVKALTEEEVADFRDAMEIRVTGDKVPKPVRTFKEASFPEYILKEVKKSGFSEPTPIQAQAWSILLSGRDCIALAETGSGKTLAFMLPAIVHINAQPMLQRGDGPIALVLAPTRELAMQIHEQAVKFGRSSRISCTVVYGGVPKTQQQQALHKGAETVIATPGRLLDLMECKATQLNRTSYVVLDEADRMLDMGFEPYIRKIVGASRTDRQTLMFSATWPRIVRALASEFLQFDVITVKIGDEELIASHNVEQEIRLLEENQKEESILKVMEDICTDDATKRLIIVFVETKKKCDALTQLLRENGFPALGFHGDKKQEERDWILNEFKTAAHPIMVATGVASRGLDVKNIEYVVNFDFPAAIEDYIHRVGRTGRAGAKGKAITFFSSQNYRMVNELVRILEEAEQTIDPQLWSMAYPDKPYPTTVPQHNAPGAERTAAASVRASPYPAPAGKSIEMPPPPPLIMPGTPTPTNNGSNAASPITPNSSLANWSSTSTITDGLPLITSDAPDFECVLMLRNMVGPGEVDDELQNEIEEECSKYGPVKESQIFEVRGGTVPPEEAVRIFVKFLQREVCYKALVELNGRAFGGRCVCAAIFDHDKYNNIQLAPSHTDPPMPRVVLLRNMILPGEVDDELENEIRDKCLEYGPVDEVKIREVADKSFAPEESVRVFVCFKDYVDTLEACRDLNGRLFNGRLIHCCLYDNNRFFARDLNPNRALEPILPYKCYLPLTSAF